jgi:hypothetical protein
LSGWKDPKAVEEPMPDEDLLESEGKNPDEEGKL